MLAIPAQAQPQQQAKQGCCTELCEDFKSNLLADPTNPNPSGVYALIGDPVTVQHLMHFIDLMHDDMVKYQKLVDCLKRQTKCIGNEQKNGNSFLVSLESNEQFSP